MTGKFFRRTLRNVVLGNRPYFAHLALTHRCNLKCRFCHVTEMRFRELDTNGMKRVIDVLDRAGVAVISISGGGEPLLRDDFDEIINYASSLGLYVKLTSNGTMPRAKYERLLKSRIDEIGISLDGVNGHDLPYSHIGTPILETLQYLNDNLPAGKHLTVNVTVSEDNRDQVGEILKYCAERYPRARVWLNPVVVGEGALRTSTAARSKPDYLETANSPTLLKAPFYNRGAQEQFLTGDFDWGCKAGDVFFDVKPNGDYWFCQDQPSPVPLNVLDSDFERRRRAIDKTSRRNCAGCIYSCYYLVQKGLETRHWRDMALLWWQANTAPGGPERDAAAQYGPIGAMASLLWRSMSARPARMALRGLAALCLAASLMAAPPAPAVAPEEVLTRMEEAGARQQALLQQWSHQRVYTAANSRLGRSATAKVQVDYSAPGSKTWRMIEASGSGLIVNRVIEPLLEAEQEGARPEVRPASDIRRVNYVFRYAGYDEQLHAYVFDAAPRVPSRFQFRGHVAIDAETFAVRRVWGEPALRPSFWVRKTSFVHEYARFGDFWLPVRNRTEVELRLLGRSTLAIDYGDYLVNPAISSQRCIRSAHESACVLR